MLHDLFHIPIPLLEKILRPIAVYLTLVILLRLFGKRELAQLNPFDLVLLLMLSNTVQNAIIGDDNSLSGGVVGAVALLSINPLMNRLLFKLPKLDRALQSEETVLIRDGEVDWKAMEREILTKEELVQAVHKQNMGLSDVKLCVLEPNGTFFISSMEDSRPRQRHDELLARMDALQQQVAELQRQREA